MTGGFHLDNQKIIRNAFFRKRRQQILEVVLKNVNFGLQRGTLVNIIFKEYDNAVILFMSSKEIYILMDEYIKLLKEKLGIIEENV